MSEPRKRPPWVFGLDEADGGIARELAPGVSARIFAGAQAMLSVVRLAPHAATNVHAHPEEQWGVLLEGECVRLQDGEEAALRAGDFWHTPGGVEHGLRAGPGGALVLDIFSPPRAEYRKPGKGTSG